MCSYVRPTLLFNGHIETIYPFLFRRLKKLPYQRERINTSDDDFIDIDWLTQHASKLIILCHGLEGSSQSNYMGGMAKAFYYHGYDVLAWNYRGCSGEMNLQQRFYHAGATDDLHRIVSHALSNPSYSSISLIGFSLGGNLVLKYLGERATKINTTIKNSVVFSVPLNLHETCLNLLKESNRIYATRFLRSLKKKVIDKSKINPSLNIQGIDKIKNILEFDDSFTAPLHLFQNAIDYYHQCSSIHFIHQIEVPTLIINALNDPLLSQACYHHSALHTTQSIVFKTPNYGGHTGFTLFNKKKLYWSELQALQFISSSYQHSPLS